MSEARVPDTGDRIDPNAQDPTPERVEPGDPDYVEPAAGAVRVGGAR